MSGLNVPHFVVEFDQLYHKLEQFDMKLPDGVLAFFLVSAANVSEENEKLARATCKKLTYADMKTIILKIFGDPTGEDEEGAPAIKQESVFQTEHKSVVNRGRFDKGRGGASGNHGRGSFQCRQRELQKEDSTVNSRGGARLHSNPVDEDGNPSRCYTCNSTRHLANRCAHADEERNGQVHASQFATQLRKRGRLNSFNTL